MGKIQISAFQFFILVFMFIISSSTLLIPHLVTPYAKQDVWLSAAVATAASLPLLLLYISLAKRHPGLPLTQCTERILGRTLGKAVSALFCFYFILITCGLIRQVGDMLTTLILADTPIHAVECLFVTGIVMGVRLGLESWVRSAEIFFPWVILLTAALVASLLPLIDFDKLMPMFEAKPGAVIRGSITIFGVPFLDLVIFLMIAPYVKTFKGMKRGFLYGVLAGSSILVFITILTPLVIGVAMTEQTLYPVYVLAQKVSIGNFIQRIEVVVGGIWFITMFFKIIICFHATMLGLADLFDLKNYQTLTLPFGMFSIPFSLLMFKGLISFMEFVSEIWTLSVLLYGLILPLLLLAADMWRKRRRKGAAADAG